MTPGPTTPGPTAARGTRSPAAYWRGVLSRWRTRRLLEAHLLVLFLLAAVASTALFLSCRQMEHSAEALASREAPAVQGLAATRLAALRAGQEVDDLVERQLVGVAGSGETYRSQLSAADQGLSSIADRTDQDLGTVRGLLTTYSDSLDIGTSLYRDHPRMQKQKLQEAWSLLKRDEVGLAPRLESLQRAQLRHAEATATMGSRQRGGWLITELALAAVALTLLSALFVLRDRCGRDWNPYLAAAFFLTVLLALVPVKAAACTAGSLDAAVEDLRQITEVSLREDAHPAEAQQRVTEQSEELREQMTDAAWTAGAYRGAFVGSLLAIVLPVLGLGLRLDDDYWRHW